jgi:hypothetical protein
MYGISRRTGSPAYRLENDSVEVEVAIFSRASPMSVTGERLLKKFEGGEVTTNKPRQEPTAKQAPHVRTTLTGSGGLPEGISTELWPS